jgi:MiaB/RimO family radical SAM methylthiotransferase
VSLCLRGERFFGRRNSRTPEAGSRKAKYATIENVPAYHVENFGCRATQADGAALERQFEERGLSRASAADADVVILNTCTVTAAADQDARAAIRRVQRQNPTARIVVTGCYAQRAPEEIAALPGVTCVVGNSHKHQLAEIALPFLHQLEMRASGAEALTENGSSIAALEALRHPKAESSGNRSKAESLANHPKAESLASQPKAESLAGHPKAGFSESQARAGSSAGRLADGASSFVPLPTLTAEARSLEPEARLFVSDIFAHTEFIAAPVFDAANERTRPNLKVQDGCDNRCSFCVIPYVRGQSRSLPLPQVLREVNALVEAGYREVVISGINLGRWGRDLAISHQPTAISEKPDLEPQTSDLGAKPAADVRGPGSDAAFEDLLRTILAETSLEKLRISSVEPMDWTDELIALVAGSPRIARHAHVPLQSGSDAVLRRMHRKYRPWHYREKIEKIRAAMPLAAIGADVMVGFPGETDAEFEATRQLIEELPFTYLHVFTYSARPGTPAAAMLKQVPVPVARERNRVLRELASEKKLAFMRSFIGKTMEAITLRPCGAGTHAREGSGTDQGLEAVAFTEALTDNYLQLHLKGRHDPNRWVRAQVEGVSEGVLVGSCQERRF